VLALAYRDIDLLTFQDILNKEDERQYLSEQEKALYIFSDLTLISVVAMRDQLRESS